MNSPHLTGARWATPAEPNCAARLSDTARRTPLWPRTGKARRAAVVLGLRAG